MQERGGMGTRAFKRCLRSRDRLRDREERQKQRKLRDQGDNAEGAVTHPVRDAVTMGDRLRQWVDVLKSAWEDVLARTGTPDGVGTCWRRR